MSTKETKASKPNETTGSSSSQSNAPNTGASGSSAAPLNIAGGSATSRAIPNLAKVDGAPSRGGASRMKFVPNMPMRRKKTEEASTPKQENITSATSATSSSLGDRGRGRDRGRGGAGRGGAGVGRGAAPSIAKESAQMVASGPFALGPAAAGSSNRRAGPSFAASGRLGGVEGVGSSLVRPLGASSALPRNRDALAVDEDVEIYSDGEDVVVDLGEVKKLDIMAPDALRKEKRKDRKKKKDGIVKKEDDDFGLDLKGKGKAAVDDGLVVEEKNVSQALDLSESEDEVELENLQYDFVPTQDPGFMESEFDGSRLYLFQFPAPFPTFKVPDKPAATQAESVGSPSGKRVTFADDVKQESKESAKGKEKAAPEDSSASAPLEGVIGKLEIHASGAVRMRLGDGLLYDVYAATQPSFLQQAVVFDIDKGSLNVLGPVQRRYTVSPDLDTLLKDVEKEAAMKAATNVETMDMS